MRNVWMFVLLAIFWFLLIWPSSGPFQAPDIIVGLLVAILAALIMRCGQSGKELSGSALMRIIWLLIYLCVLAYYIVKANLDVAYRVLHPEMPIRPGIVKVRTNLKSPSGITLLANSITLTPGTLTVEAEEDGVLYVHWIFVRSMDTEEATKAIISRFEWFIKRICD